MKKLSKFLTQRVVLVSLLILIQLFFLIQLVTAFEEYSFLAYSFCGIISFLVVLHIVNRNDNPGYKIAWIIPIMLFPIFGGLFYLMFGGNKISDRNKRKMRKIEYKLLANLKQEETIFEEIEKDNIDAYTQMNYIYKNAICPVYKNTYTEYFKTGEDYYKKLLEELSKAKHYIFMEYFIVSKGKMWDSILEILKKKADEGVDVRFIYDDFGCITTLPSKYHKELSRYGIKAATFNKFKPILTTKMNNRDHRKITVIDGHTAFTGGINLADEYINEYERFGYWKDNGIMLKGDAVWSFTILFLSIWDFIKGEKENYDKYFPNIHRKEKLKSSGYVQPYSDSPLDNEAVGETVYMNLINRANKYVYITTPYLILDNEMVTALSNASKSGVDVRIITPGIPDKKIVNEVTKAYYDVLIENGVKIYEYTKGFIHAKTFIVDDIYATVGTVNLDYRSLYLHFECGVLLYKTESIKDIKNDYEETLKVSKKIKFHENKIRGWFNHIKRGVLKILAPLM